MSKKFALALATVLTAGSTLANAAETPEQLLVEWGYLPAADKAPAKMVTVTPVQPRNDVEAVMIAHGIPVPGATTQVEGQFVVHDADLKPLDPVRQLLVDWDHIQRSTVTADFVKVAPNS